MAYSTRAQIDSAITATKVVELCDDEGSGPGNVLISGRVTEAIRKADGEIDGYIQARYSVPVASPEGSLTNVISISLTSYYLYQRRYGSFGLPEAVKEEYERRIKQLEKINHGTLDLGQEPPPASSTKIGATSFGPTKLFTSRSSTSGGTMGEF